MTLGELFFTVSVDSSGAKAGLKDVESSAKSMGDSAGSAMEGVSAKTIALGTIMADVAKKVVSAVVDIGKTAIEYNAQMESYTARLTTALGSQEKAVQAINAIKLDAVNSVYDTAGLVEANALLMSTGLNADESREAINALGVAVAASGGGNDVLSRMASNLQQIKNVGKATSMDIRQFAMAGIDIYGLLSDYTGKSAAEVQELEISYEMVVGALEQASREGGKYFGAMDSQMKTFNGQVSMLKSNVQEKLGKAFEGLSNTLSDSVLPQLNDWVSNLNVEDATRQVTEFVTALSGLALAANYSVIIKSLSGAFTALAANPVFLATAVIAGFSIALIEGSKGVDDYIDSLTDTDGSTEGITNQLEALRAKAVELKETMDNGYGTEMTQSEYDSTRVAIARLEAQLASMPDTVEEVVTAEADTANAVQGIISNFETGYSEIMSKYNAAYESTLASVDKWFGTFAEVEKVVPQGVDDMISALQSQIDFNNEYAENLAYLKEHGLGDMAEAFQDMGAEGAQYAANMVEAYQTGNEAQVQALEELYSEVQTSKQNVAEELTNLTGEYENAMSDLVTSTLDAVNELNLSEEARSNAVATMQAYASAISSDSTASSAAYEQGASIAAAIQSGIDGYGEIHATVSVSSEGTPRFATGLEYVPSNDFPARLHKGEMVLNRAEAEQYRSGGSSAGATVNVYAQSMDESQIDYLISRVNRQLGGAIA